MESDEKMSLGDELSLKDLDSLLRQRHVELEESLRRFMDRHDLQMKQLLDSLNGVPEVEVANVADAECWNPEERPREHVNEGAKPKFERSMSEASLGEGRSHFRRAKSRRVEVKTFETLKQATYLRQKVQTFLGHHITELCIAAFTLLSAFVVGFQVEEAAQHATDATYRPNLVVTVINHALTFGFTGELLLRIYAFGRAFVWSEDWQWNFLDVIIVSASLVELLLDIVAWTSIETGTGARFGDLSIIKAMRVVRILRLVRVFRVVRFFRSLRVLISSIIHTLRSVIWALTLLTLIMYTFAILFTYCYTDFVHNNPNKLEDAERLRRYFGSVPVSVLNLFAAISDGISWTLMSAPLYDAGWFWLALFVSYIALATFADSCSHTELANSLGLSIAEFPEEMVIEAQLKSKKMYTDQVRTLFHLMDEDQSGELTAHAFEEHINEPQVAAYFRALDMDLNNAWKLFTLLDPDNSGTIDLTEFVEGCLKLRGPATRLDMEMVLSVARNTAKRQNQLVGKLESLERRVANQRGTPFGAGTAQLQQRNLQDEGFEC
eukprot:s836_g9.t1